MRTRIRYRHGVTIGWKAEVSWEERKESIFQGAAASCYFRQFGPRVGQIYMDIHMGSHAAAPRTIGCW